MNASYFQNKISDLYVNFPSSSKSNLENIGIVLKKLGNPHHKLPLTFHIAGTNGKGSTQAFLKSILNAAGYKVHAYTSPHLVRFTERIVVGDHEITEKMLLDYLERIFWHMGKYQLSWFEIITIAAFLAFVEHPADVTILETGMGGRLDATNIIVQPACTLITSISYDHQLHLGKFIKEIAYGKSGIFKPGIPIISCQQDPEVMEVLYRQAVELNCPIYSQPTEWQSELQDNTLKFTFKNISYYFDLPGLEGGHQLQNVGTALAALKITMPELLERLHEVNLGLKNVQWAGRFQNLHAHPYYKLLKRSQSRLYLDCAHNAGGFQALTAFIKEKHMQYPVLILGVLRKRNLDELLPWLKGHIKYLIGVSIPNETSYSGEEIAEAALKYELAATSFATVEEALSSLASPSIEYDIGTDKPLDIIICGSIYLAGQVLQDHNGHNSC